MKVHFVGLFLRDPKTSLNIPQIFVLPVYITINVNIGVASKNTCLKSHIIDVMKAR